MQQQRYRDMEQALWDSVGVRPVEREVHLATDGIRVRVQQLGHGPAVLLLHGGPNAGSTFAPLAAHLPGRQLLLVDRPGTGRSDPLPLSAQELPGFADRFAVEVLDALGLDGADLVGSSFGGYLALRAAAAHPERFGRMVQLACPAFVADMAVPPLMRFLSSPLSRILEVVPANARGGKAVLRRLGHAATIRADGVTDEMLAWSASLQNDTDTFRHDLANIRGYVVRGRVHPALTLAPELLARVTCPTLVAWGADDPFGGIEVGRRLVAELPDAELVVLPHSGHLPWLDDPAGLARLVEDHLDRSEARRRTG